MFKRNLVPVWVGILLLSGIFLVGQEPWSPGPGPSQLPDTGQTLCYDNTTVIECPGPGQPFSGQDAQYVTNPMSYTVSPDGLTVADNVTGLMWQRVDDDTTRTWGDAITYCDGLALGGHTHWRLPNEYELQSIVHYGRYNPSIDRRVFPGTNSTGYWSSSTFSFSADYAWAVDFYDGGVYCGTGKTYSYYVRCVRREGSTMSFTVNQDGTVTDNANGLMWQQQDDNQKRDWQAALAYCQCLSLGGYSDWRLPDVKELRTIVDNTRWMPSIDPTLFPNTMYNYWSSSTYVHRVDDAWVVAFGDGSVHETNKTYTSYVRCVR